MDWLQSKLGYETKGDSTQEEYVNACPGSVGQEQSAHPRVGAGVPCPPHSLPCDNLPHFPKAKDCPLCSHA